MAAPQQQYDDAMFAFSQADYATAARLLAEVLAGDPENFEARLALGMTYYRLGDFPQAIAEGHKAEQLRPNEQLVHTNLSLFYMKSGDKVTAEKHGLKARIASWREPAEAKPAEATDPELQLAQPKAAPVAVTGKKLPDMPWKKNKPIPSSNS
ncbi:MAG TPA: tetratricopeptide repeat protein [Verrucomicrobiae bacterium]|jgi:predicted Zn-dependent protease|nr:tetratricopeptide repeat protein [Verrucomicrobiae bacterium]